MRKRLIYSGLAVVAAAAVAVGGVGFAANADDGVDASDSQTKIIGGVDADQDYSFMASMQGSDGSHRCGASLISPEWLIIAAHCVEGEDPSGYQFRLNTKTVSDGGEVVKPTEFVVHPDYSGGVDDLALVKLEAAAESAPVKLGSEASPGTKSRILGWGATNPDGSGAPETLQQLDTAVVESSKCTEIGEKDLCTDNPNGDSGACYGDSGGPQIVDDGSGGWVLIGATSRSGNGDPTCATGPSIYTNVTAYTDWINETTGA
ncbi:S1 family peptidase [Stackebrandtia nassauensis]|uniref:Peptidase S1 and S6 chymotrypsin/Hap n=1 Tax=Stackebrandtia nassauensis (strain DSM 44728 / CIP 108903 / NRRL B-16338 / NBRC 102104 / LLR-40K-21) TaxID=446470 RepID=D3QBJ9_STANL|nr:serine protease [Stackebrandtia nassauensis]ADD42881.1 peptidase S1 and S6 chymotrypsin/Hap [Stackebrandtia nassauensis DSM 44728]